MREPDAQPELTSGAAIAAATAKFTSVYGAPPAHTTYAPGRVEVLGNHTDYNDGFVFSAAIDRGTACCARRIADGGRSRITAGDLMQTAAFDTARPTPDAQMTWANYVIGVAAGLGLPDGASFELLFYSDVPRGAGLSSSAALEMSAGLALAAAFGLEPDPIALARIGQRAEHEYAGVRCGLLDQVSSLYGRRDHLVHTDFRTLKPSTVPLGDAVELLICNTHAAHRLVDSEYNERRERCEEAAAWFAAHLDHPVEALRDVSWDEWTTHQAAMPQRAAQRSAHVIGENERVTRGAALLRDGKVEDFGALMYASHESSQTYFENSCPELDHLVAACRELPDVLGARLSGGGFGGSIVALVRRGRGDAVARALAPGFRKTFGHDCESIRTTPADGARRVERKDAS